MKMLMWLDFEFKEEDESEDIQTIWRYIMKMLMWFMNFFIFSKEVFLQNKVTNKIIISIFF